MQIAGKNIIITGASSGIGKEMLNLLKRYKAVKIIAVARHTDSIEAIEDTIFPFAADISKPEEIDRLFVYARQIYGDTDIFIANAGFTYIEKLANPNWEHIENIFRTNVFSPIYALEKLAVESDKPKAFVVTISGAGLIPLPAYSLYCSTKAALHQFVETYRYEKKDLLQITCVYPVATRTRFFDKATGKRNTPLPFLQQEAKTVAKKIIKGVEKEKKKVFPSRLFKLFYPIGRAFPFLLKIYSSNEKRKIKSRL